MNVDVRIESAQLKGRAPYYAYIERHLHFAFGRFAAKLGRVSVRVDDVPGAGNIPASCRIQVQLLPTGG
jgi:hypothetical protein